MTRILAKLAVLFGAVALIQLTVAGRLWHRHIWSGPDLREFAACMDREPDVVHLCDSSNFWTDPNDADRSEICEYLDEGLGAATAVSLDGGAFHAGIYEAFLDLMISSGRKPRAIVMPINLRSFSPEWDLKPAYAFEERIHQIRHADSLLASAAIPVLRTFQGLGGEPLSLQAFHASPVYLGTNRVGTVWDFDNPDYRRPTPERTRNRLIYYYLYALDEGHRRLAAFQRISHKAAAAGIGVVFYITPIDVETGERHLPGQFAPQVMANVRIIRAALTAHQPPVMDLSSALPSACFADDDYRNEHLKEAGRRWVAERLAGALMGVLGPRRDSGVEVDGRLAAVPPKGGARHSRAAAR